MIEIRIEQKHYPMADALCDEFPRTFLHSGLSARVRQRKADIAPYVW